MCEFILQNHLPSSLYYTFLSTSKTLAFCLPQKSNSSQLFLIFFLAHNHFFRLQQTFAFPLIQTPLSTLNCCNPITTHLLKMHNLKWVCLIPQFSEHKMQNLRWVLRIFMFLSLFHQLSACPPPDRAALLSFKSKIATDTTGILSSWVGTDCCSGDWEGVECNPSTGRVTSLVLQKTSSDVETDLYMKGSLSPSLGSLPFLEVLVISGMKHIAGAIPGSLATLKHLSQLILEDNSLSGVIPSGIGHMPSLKTLSLGGNRLQGAIPPSLGGLSGLLQLNLARNNMVGTIPPGLRGLCSLQVLDLSRNQLSGPLPDFIGRFRNLTYLDLSYNNLCESIPISLCSLTALSDLSLSNNNLRGVIPNKIGSLKSLSSLSLGANQLSGTIPESLARLDNLWYLNLSRNALTNPLPSVLAKGIPSLLSIDMSFNKLDLGSVPSWIRSRELSAVHLAGCKLFGALPNFTKPSSLSSLDLSHNQFSEGIPHFFTRMTNIETINLSNNKFKYDISNITLPDELSSIDLSSNQFFGSLTKILGNNPSSFLESIDVSMNLISGTLPEFGEGLNLKVISIGSNKIGGMIPSSISNLAELQHLDVSRNQITGTIPTGLGQLTKLQWLDISINSLTGRIPASLLGIKNLKHASFRANQLCGPIPQGRPLNVFPASAYAHNSCLCGKPLTPCRGKMGQQ